MPLFEYKCNDCEYIEERLVFDRDTKNPKCTKCGGKTEKLISTPGIVRVPKWH